MCDAQIGSKATHIYQDAAMGPVNLHNMGKALEMQETADAVYGRL